MAKDLRGASATALRTQGVRRTEQTPTITPSPVNLRTTHVEADKKVSSLESDLKKLGVGLSQTATATHEASIYADKVRSNDAYTNFVAGMQQIDKHYQDKLDKGQALTVSDYKEKKDWQNSFYQDMINNSITEGDETNLIYKETFINPATNMLMKTNKIDTDAQFQVHKRNVIDNVNENIDKMGTNLTTQNVEMHIQSLKAVGIGGARDRVWSEVATSANNEFKKKYADGLDSVELQHYLDENGRLTQDGIDRLYTDNYGNFSKRKDGTYESVAGDITDEAHISMMKSFNGWIDGYNNALDKATTNNEETITDTTAKVDVSTTSVADVDKAVEESGKQFTQVHHNMTPSKLASLKDTMVKLADKQAEIHLKDSIYNRVMGRGIDPDTGLPVPKTPVNFDELMAFDWRVEQVERQIAPNVTVTTTAKTLPRAEIEKYLDNRFYKDYQAVIKSGDTEAAADFGQRLAMLRDSGFKGSSATGAIKNSITGLTNTGGKSSKSIGELVNEVTAVSEFIESSGTPNASFLGDKAVRSVASYINYLNTVAETDTKLTEDKILAMTKNYVYGLSRDYEAVKNGSKTMKSLNDITEDENEHDALVSGYVMGETTFAGGVYNILTTLATKEDLAPDSTEKFVDYAKTKTMELDETHFNIFGDSTTIVNPVSDNSRAGQQRVRNNMEKLVRDSLIEANVEAEIDIDDITDEENARLFQYVDQNGDIMTVLNVYSNGKIILPIVMSPDDLETGVRAYKNKTGVK